MDGVYDISKTIIYVSDVNFSRIKNIPIFLAYNFHLLCFEPV